jgi:hypothetical protein
LAENEIFPSEKSTLSTQKNSPNSSPLPQVSINQYPDSIIFCINPDAGSAKSEVSFKSEKVRSSYEGSSIVLYDAPLDSLSNSFMAYRRDQKPTLLYSRECYLGCSPGTFFVDNEAHSFGSKSQIFRPTPQTSERIDHHLCEFDRNSNFGLFDFNQVQLVSARQDGPADQIAQGKSTESLPPGDDVTRVPEQEKRVRRDVWGIFDLVRRPAQSARGVDCSPDVVALNLDIPNSHPLREGANVPVVDDHHQLEHVLPHVGFVTDLEGYSYVYVISSESEQKNFDPVEPVPPVHSAREVSVLSCNSLEYSQSSVGGEQQKQRLSNRDDPRPLSPLGLGADFSAWCLNQPITGAPDFVTEKNAVQQAAEISISFQRQNATSSNTARLDFSHLEEVESPVKIYRSNWCPYWE